MTLASVRDSHSDSDKVSYAGRTWRSIEDTHCGFSIPGPKKAIVMSDVEIARWTAIPPQAGPGTIGIGIMSYAGGISIGVAADRVPGSEGVARRICEGFNQRFELYVERATEVLDHQD